jgi:hypothetical protein
VPCRAKSCRAIRNRLLRKRATCKLSSGVNLSSPALQEDFGHRGKTLVACFNLERELHTRGGILVPLHTALESPFLCDASIWVSNRYP